MSFNIYIQGGSMRKLVIFIFIAFIAILLAQRPPEPVAPPPENERPDVPEPRKWIERIRIVTLIDELDLNEEQIAKFLPKFKDHQRLEQEFFKKRTMKFNELREMLQNEKISEDKIKVRIDEFEKMRTDFQKNQEALRKEMEAMLTTRQKAKLLVFQADFERKIREIIEKVRKQRPLQKRLEPPEPE